MKRRTFVETTIKGTAIIASSGLWSCLPSRAPQVVAFIDRILPAPKGVVFGTTIIGFGALL